MIGCHICGACGDPEHCEPCRCHDPNNPEFCNCDDCLEEEDDD